jgi:catechol 2,3-dioxygenase-like lactoylglutathione lyase family enzyme
MQRICLFVTVCVLAAPTAPAGTKRPKILGISAVTVYVSDINAARRFYSEDIGLLSLADPTCRRPEESCYGIGSSQRIDILQGSGSLTDSSVGDSSVGEITFLTDDIFKMQNFLTEHSVHTTGIVQLGGTKSFPNKHYHISTADPDGHRIGFIQYVGCVTCSRSSDHAIGERIVHTGFIVRQKLRMDQFYEDVLGFRPYWHGGMKDGEDNWVDMQVPDGTDWIEYMLGVSPDASHKTLGVMNHIALGVPDIHAAQQQLIKNGWKGTEEPKIGRDGKWQLNLYDPDETRVELMEFKPTKEPCCSPYTGPHPGPKQ